MTRVILESVRVLVLLSPGEQEWAEAEQERVWPAVEAVGRPPGPVLAQAGLVLEPGVQPAQLAAAVATEETPVPEVQALPGARAVRQQV